MKRARLFFSHLTILIALSGSLIACASSQPLDKAAIMSIRSIVLVGPSEPSEYIAARDLPGILAAGPVGAGVAAADRNDKEFDTRIRSTGLRLGQEIRNAIGDALRKDGYDVIDREIPRTTLNLIGDYRGRNLDGDAALDAWLLVRYATGELDDSYAPQLGMSVQLVDLKTNKILFRSGLTYAAHGVIPPTFRPAPRYSFAGREELMRNTELATEGLRAAIPLIAEWVGQSLAK
jgi:hypothetical protein